MRIVYIVSQYPTLTETFVAREIEQLVRMGHSVTICPLRLPANFNGPSGFIVRKAEILRKSLNPFELLSSQIWLFRQNTGVGKACWRDILENWSKLSRLHHLIYILLVSTRLAKHLEPLRIDHIRGHHLHSEALSCMWLARMLGISYSLTAHTKTIRFSQPLIAKTARGASFLVGDTQEVCDLLKNMQPSEVYLIRNGLDLQRFPFRGAKPALSTLPVILAVGSLVRKKGFDELIRACDLMNRRGIPFLCRIVGEGPERVRLENMVQELRLENVVQMPGAIPFHQLETEYVTADIFVMPSKNYKYDSDGLPTVLIESLALGIPVVATRKAGIPDLIKDGHTGLLAEPNDPESLADCLARVLGDLDLQLHLSLYGRKLVENEFDLSKSVSRLSELIDKQSSVGFNPISDNEVSGKEKLLNCKVN